MNIFESVILAIVEGLTEFLPVSSTGHMSIAAALMQMKQDDFLKTFTVAIQFGAILSVVVLYFKRFFQSVKFYTYLLAAFIPAAVVGVLFNDKIDALLENIPVIGCTLLIGGVIMLFIDRLFAANEFRSNQEEAEKMSYKKAFIVGVFQCIAMVPGVSRSASTIVGGLTQKLNRKTAAEFSFFLAVPTMFAATAKKMWDSKEILQAHASEYATSLIIGNIVAFVVAMFAIKFFIGLVSKSGFKWFGVYRIIVGAFILYWFYTNHSMTIL